MTDRLTYAQVSAVLRHENGVLIWKESHKTRAGTPAGCKNKHGYIRIGLKGKTMFGHRVVWLLEHGEWPSGALDHRNGIRDDNRPENLRECTDTQNHGNRRPYVGRLKGVTLHKQTGKYQATIARTYIGLYDNAECAARAYDDAARRRYGEFAWTNFGGVA